MLFWNGVVLAVRPLHIYSLNANLLKNPEKKFVFEQTHSFAVDHRIFFASKIDHQGWMWISSRWMIRFQFQKTFSYQNTNDDAQPIKGFSQRSLVSHSTFHFLVLCVPDCIAFRAGTKIRQRRSSKRSLGTPDKGPMDSFRKQNSSKKKQTNINQRTSCRGISVRGDASIGFWVSTAVRPQTFWTSNKVLEITLN